MILLGGIEGMGCRTGEGGGGASEGEVEGRSLYGYA